MPMKRFARLTPEEFLQIFVSQSLKVGANMGCACCGRVDDYIEQMGLAASQFFEGGYRDENAVDGNLDEEQYLDAIVKLKNRIGGNFSRATSLDGAIRVTNTSCPFGDPVKNAPELCRMTSSVFGGIAARNFGFAKVILNKRIALGDGVCDVSIITDPELAAGMDGDEYHRTTSGEARSSRATEAAQRSTLIAEKMHEAWSVGEHGKQPTGRKRPFLVAKSNDMRNALEVVEIVAPSTTSVLITGETGVGKEVIARAIHAMSERMDRPFVPVNCGTIPETLIESALFGHEKGSFTGAYEVHQGYFERAEGGTLFLDEIDSLPLAAQVRLLRVLQEGEFERVGAKQIIRSDVRIVAASGRPLPDLIDAGAFRRDLFYRLNVVPISISPLRERTEDIVELVPHILSRLSERYERDEVCLSPEAMNQILAYSWPGNVRELENVLERSFLFCRASIITNIVLDESATSDTAAATTTAPGTSLRTIKKEAANRAERALLENYLQKYQGNVSATARELGLSRRAVHQKLNAHKLDATSYRATRNSS